MQSRIDRGPQAAQELLGETRRIYHLLEDELVAAGFRGRAQRTLLYAAPVAFFLGWLLGWRAC